ncbi:MAG: hypothetical protein ACE5GO_11365, partial [Anaerolineales bacterium]
MKRLYPLRIPFLLIILPLLSLLAAACNPFAAGPTPPPTPTPDVPSILEVDSAIKRWEAGNNRRYFVEVEEVNVEGTYLIRVVIADGEVRVAQRVEKVDGKWQAPVALDFAIAQNYTVDALLQRVRNDALGEGAAPMNMFVIFDTISGFPSVVETTALPTHNEQGQLRLNREHNYTLGVNVGVLIEDQVGLGKEPVMSLTRSGGANAWCDVLRIFPDGSSIYTDDCRQTLLQMRPPSASFAALEEISGGITGIDEWAENEGGRLHLVIYGAGGSDPDNTTLADTWELATELADLLSRPIGAGVTLLYTRHSVLFGFDMRTLLAQSTSVDIREPLYGALVSPDSGYLVHADGAGMHWLDTASGNSGIIFSNPSGAHYLPRGWGEQVLVLQRVPDKGDGTPEWGWTNLDDRSWHPIALKSGAFSCDDGVSVSPAAAEMVIAVGGEDCSVDVGLTLVYIEDGGIRNLVDPILTREAI